MLSVISGHGQLIALVLGERVIHRVMCTRKDYYKMVEPRQINRTWILNRVRAFKDYSHCDIVVNNIRDISMVSKETQIPIKLKPFYRSL